MLHIVLNIYMYLTLYATLYYSNINFKLVFCQSYFHTLKYLVLYNSNALYTYNCITAVTATVAVYSSIVDFAPNELLEFLGIARCTSNSFMNWSREAHSEETFPYLFVKMKEKYRFECSRTIIRLAFE